MNMKTDYYIFVNGVILQVPDNSWFTGIRITYQHPSNGVSRSWLFIMYTQEDRVYSITYFAHYTQVWSQVFGLQRKFMKMIPRKANINDHIFCKLRHIDNKYTKSLLKKFTNVST